MFCNVSGRQFVPIGGVWLELQCLLALMLHEVLNSAITRKRLVDNRNGRPSVLPFAQIVSVEALHVNPRSPPIHVVDNCGLILGRTRPDIRLVARRFRLR